MGIRVLEESAGNIFCKEAMLISTHEDTCRYIWSGKASGLYYEDAQFESMLTSCGVPGGKHITRRVGEKNLGITWRYYNLRYAHTDSTAFHRASEHGVPAPDL